MDIQTDEFDAKAIVLLDEAKAIATKPDATAEDMDKAGKMLADAKALKARSTMLVELEALKAEAVKGTPKPSAAKAGKFGTFGEFLVAVHNATFKAQHDPRLEWKVLPDESPTGPFTMQNGFLPEQKQLVENTGGSGGFLVFPEHLTEMFALPELARYVRQRATTIPMRARVIQIPVLDQTSTGTAGSHYYGGVIPKWTEEAGTKDESEPAFRQMELVAHKLVVYTEASDELLADSAVSLESLLQALFAGSIYNEEEWCFIQGTGAGQPLGIANTACGATIAVARAVAGAIGLQDIFDMVTQFSGSNPVWLAHQRCLPSILALNGPAANPAYVWVGNGRDQMPTTLMGYPIYFIENCPALGARGDICLCDWSKYLIGDRQAVPIDSSKHYKFRNDLTSWRAVHRVDGRPWLSAPLTFRDGVTQVSPFVVLDAAVAS